APMRPYNKLVHPRSWRAFMEYGNGIIGDMCIHMLDMTRWMLGLGWPKSVSSIGGILVEKNSKANISDTQSATFDGDKGTLKASVMGYDFTPQGKGDPIHKDVTYELEQYPEDKTEKDLE